MNVTAASSPYADDRLAHELGVSVKWCRPLARRGVRNVEDMRAWTLDDLRAVPYVGGTALKVLVPALRDAGCPLLDAVKAGV